MPIDLSKYEPLTIRSGAEPQEETPGVAQEASTPSVEEIEAAGQFIYDHAVPDEIKTLTELQAKVALHFLTAGLEATQKEFVEKYGMNEGEGLSDFVARLHADSGVGGLISSIRNDLNAYGLEKNESITDFVARLHGAVHAELHAHLDQEAIQKAFTDASAAQERVELRARFIAAVLQNDVPQEYSGTEMFEQIEKLVDYAISGVVPA